jgi:hypothetical protein
MAAALLGAVACGEAGEDEGMETEGMDAAAPAEQMGEMVDSMGSMADSMGAMVDSMKTMVDSTGAMDH